MCLSNILIKKYILGKKTHVEKRIKGIPTLFDDVNYFVLLLKILRKDFV